MKESTALLFADSVVGSWTEREIRASYMPSGEMGVAVIVAVLVALIAIRIRAGSRTREMFVALGSSVVSGLCYFLLVQYFASSLSVDAPLSVKVHGLTYLPFFLGTQDAGLGCLAALFLLVNWFGLRAFHKAVNPEFGIAALNLGFAAVLGIIAFCARIAILMGVGR